MATVLVVDDDEDIRDVIAMALERRGWHVASAGDGAEALALLADIERPSLILLDLRMPGMSGGELVTELRRSPGLSEVPVVVLSGDGTAREASRGLDVQGFVAKPMELRELVEVVERHAR